MTAADDRLLVDRCVAGEPGAWRVFVDRFAPMVKALARRYLRLRGRFADDADVEDVVQDVFHALTRKDYKLLRNYDPTFAFTTYLGVITRTEVYRALRKRVPVLGDMEQMEAIPNPGAGPGEDASGAEEAEAVAKALDELPPRDAEILRLRYLREMDYRSIAVALRIPESSVGQTLFRAKRKLLERLKGLLGLLA